MHPIYHFLELHLTISDGFVPSKLYIKRDDFDFDIVHFPISYGDIPRATPQSNIQSMDPLREKPSTLPQRKWVSY